MKPFIKSLTWLVLLNLMVKPVWLFFIDRQVQVIVGHEVYGQYFALINLSLIFLFIADAGISNMMNQRLAARTDINVIQLLKNKLALVFIYTASCFIAGWLTGISQWELLIYIVLVQALTSFFTFLRSIITANQFYTTDALFSVLDKTLMILVCGGFIYGWFRQIDIFLFLRIQLFSTLTAVLAALAFLYSKQLPYGSQRQRINEILREVFPFAMIILLMSMHYRLDGFLLERMHPNGAYEAGIYASAYRLVDAGNMAGYLVASFLVPYIARHSNDRILVEKLILNSRNALLLAGLAAACFVLVFAPALQQLLYYSSSGYITAVTQLTISVLPAYYLTHIYGSALTATNQLRSFIYVLCLAVSINLLLNLLLIPLYGASGAGIAALCSQYTCAILVMLIAGKKLNLSAGKRSMLLVLVSSLLLAGFFILCKTFIKNTWLPIIVAALSIPFIVAQISYFRKNFFSHA